jgi:predicted HTH transcriptional regulator
MVRRCVWSRNLVNQEAMTRVGSQRHKKKWKNVVEFWNINNRRYSVFECANLTAYKQINNNTRAKFTLEQTMKAQWRSRDIALLSF